MFSVHDLLGVEEAKSLRFLKAAAAELIGTCILVLVGCGSVSTLNSGGQPDTLAVAFAFGLAVAACVWLFGHVSGSHLNPSVTIGLLVTGHISILKCVVFVAVQLLGGIVGTTILWLTLPESWKGSFASTTLAPGVADWQGVIIELIATFCLVMTVFASCDRLRTDHGGSTALAVGLCLTAQITWTGGITGGSMNPARSLGPAIFSGVWENHWVYWTAPIAGGILAGLAYEHVFAEKRPETNKALNRVQLNNCDIKSSSLLHFIIDTDRPQHNGIEIPLTNNRNYYKSGETIHLDDHLEKEQTFTETDTTMNSNNRDSDSQDKTV